MTSIGKELRGTCDKLLTGKTHRRSDSTLVDPSSVKKTESYIMSRTVNSL